MLILLPPSEGKADSPSTGTPLDLNSLSFPELTPTRQKVLASLVKLAQGPRGLAVTALGLTPGLADEVDKDAALLTSPALAVADLYTGVLYDALDLAELPPAARRRANERLVTFSALFGALQPLDQVPSYRLSPAAKLPRLDSLASIWKLAMSSALDAVASEGVVLDLRSGPYSALWRPGREIAQRTVTVRVLHEVAPGKRMVVSHFNKATKGRIVNGLLRQRSTPACLADLADALRDDGWGIETDPTGTKIDVVVAQV